MKFLKLFVVFITLGVTTSLFAKTPVPAELKEELGITIFQYCVEHIGDCQDDMLKCVDFGRYCNGFTDCIVERISLEDIQDYLNGKEESLHIVYESCHESGVQFVNKYKKIEGR